MLIEMHAHTSRHSPCSLIDPAELVERVRMKGLQGLVITEHDYLWSPAELEDLRKQTGLDGSFLLAAAQEVSTDIGHVLVYGADHTIEGISSLKELRARYPRACLLYTSPSPRDRTRTRMPSSA